MMKTPVRIIALVVTVATSLNATAVSFYAGTQEQLDNEINAARSLWTQANDARVSLLNKPIADWTTQEQTDFAKAGDVLISARKQLETLTAYQGATPAKSVSSPVAVPSASSKALVAPTATPAMIPQVKQLTPVKTYVAHNDPTGIPVPPVTTHAEPAVAASTTATITKVEADTATQQQIQANVNAIDSNATALRAVGDVVQAQGEYVQQQSQVIAHNAARLDQNSAQIQRNSQRIDENSKRIDETKEDLKRGLNNAAAMTGLHYKSDNAWALSTGTANGNGAAMAGGIQKGVTEHLNVNVQASTSFDSGWMASAGLSGDF